MLEEDVAALGPLAHGLIVAHVESGEVLPRTELVDGPELVEAVGHPGAPGQAVVDVLVEGAQLGRNPVPHRMDVEVVHRHVVRGPDPHRPALAGPRGLEGIAPVLVEPVPGGVHQRVHHDVPLPPQRQLRIPPTPPDQGHSLGQHIPHKTVHPVRHHPHPLSRRQSGQSAPLLGQGRIHGRRLLHETHLPTTRHRTIQPLHPRQRPPPQTREQGHQAPPVMRWSPVAVARTALTCPCGGRGPPGARSPPRGAGRVRPRSPRGTRASNRSTTGPRPARPGRPGCRA